MRKCSACIVLFFLLVGGIITTGYSQEALQPRLSPLEMVTMKYEDTYLKITYSRPHKKNRNVFGDLEPFGKVWRTGANEATEMTVTGDIRINNRLLKAGTYAIFTIPNLDKWTIIINKELGQWGAYNYNEEEDLMRFDVPVVQTDVVYEPFTIEFEQKQENKINMLMIWDSTKVIIPIEFI